MLAQTVRNNLKDINNLKMRTKTNVSDGLYVSKPMEVLSTYVDDETRTVPNSEPVSMSEISDYIVENPEEVIVEFPLSPITELKEKLPFFKSISYKLAH